MADSLEVQKVLQPLQRLDLTWRLMICWYRKAELSALTLSAGCAASPKNIAGDGLIYHASYSIQERLFFYSMKSLSIGLDHVCRFITPTNLLKFVYLSHAASAPRAHARTSQRNLPNRQTCLQLNFCLSLLSMEYYYVNCVYEN
jgi:hypothetical protein